VIESHQCICHICGNEITTSGACGNFSCTAENRDNNVIVKEENSNNNFINEDLIAMSNENQNLKMAQVIHCLSELTNGNAIIVTDVGQHQMSAARYYKFKTKNSLITFLSLETQ
jgi:thiamine pyrophosphate-dependent acetolactate synthase large subunit-like protein